MGVIRVYSNFQIHSNVNYQLYHNTYCNCVYSATTLILYHNNFVFFECTTEPQFIDTQGTNYNFLSDYSYVIGIAEANIPNSQHSLIYTGSGTVIQQSNIHTYAKSILISNVKSGDNLKDTATTASSRIIKVYCIE